MAQPAISAADSLPPPARGRYPLFQAARIVHPFPTLLNGAATAGLAVVASGGWPDGSLLPRMLLTMLCAQSLIGVTNDYFDRDLDAASKPWKPLVSGVVSQRGALVLIAVLAVVTVAVAATLGVAGFTLALAGTACGLAYDVRLKRTVFSAVPYMIAIPLLPLWVWATLGEWQPVLWWLLPLGAMLGLSLHLANTLPDIESDAAAGVSGLAHALGMQRSMYVAWGAFAAALAISLAVAAYAGDDLRWYFTSFAIGAGLLVGSIRAYLYRQDEWSLRLGFAALAVGAVVVSVGWLAAVT
jgi:4-hydroxybenzoate polyprenyltransferase